MTKAKRAKTVRYSAIEAEGQRLVLRSYKVSDFQALRRSCEGRLPKVDRFDDPVPISKDADRVKLKQRIQRHREKAKAGEHFIFGAFDKKTGEYIGQIDFALINAYLRWANLGYVIQNQYRKRGYATEAALLGLRVAFEKLNFHRVEAATEPANKASRKVAINVGLVPEGKRIKFFPDKGGIDMVVFAQNAIDYRKLKRT